MSTMNHVSMPVTIRRTYIAVLQDSGAFAPLSAFMLDTVDAKGHIKLASQVAAIVSSMNWLVATRFIMSIEMDAEVVSMR